MNREHQRQLDARCDCCGDSEGEWLDSLAADLSDGERANLCFEADVDGTLMEALMYSWRTGDWQYAATQCDKHALPVIQQAARDEAERLGDPS